MNRSTCPASAVLEALVNDSVTADEEALLGRHLESCQECRQQLDAISGSERFRSLARGAVHDGLTSSARLHEAMRILQATEPPDPQPDTATSVEAFVLETLAPSGNPEFLGRLGHYDVVRVVGRGGMGVVLEGRDSKLNRAVALKVISPLLAVDHSFRKRFGREGQAAAAINHPNVVTIYAIEDGGVLPYLVMEFVRGESIAERINRHGPLPVDEIVRIGTHVSLGLHAAHSHGVIHRDIKPSNILLEPRTGLVKITDFGLAQLEQQSDLTRLGALLGTPEFMAPEQARGETVDQRTDLYSLGSVLYTMASGQAPFQGNSTLAVLARVAEASPQALEVIRPDLPGWLVDLISRLHALDPSERFGSARDVATALREQGLRIPPASPIAAAPAIVAPEVAAPPVVAPPVTGPLQFAQPVAIQPLAAQPLATQTSATRAGTLQAETVVARTNEPNTIPVHLTTRIFQKNPGPQALVVLSIVAATLLIATMYFAGNTFAPYLGLGNETRFNEPRFVVELGEPGRQTFATLEEAIAAAAGKPIEIRSNRRLILSPLVVKQPTHLRAARGYLPVLQLESLSTRVPLIEAHAPLLLEGIELRINDRQPNPVEVRPCLRAAGGKLTVINCRFVLQPGNPNQTAIFTDQLDECVIRNCQFIGGTAVDWHAGPNASLTVENSLIVGDACIMLAQSPQPRTGSISLVGNSMMTVSAMRIGLDDQPSVRRPEDQLQVSAKRNIFQIRESMLWLNGPLGFDRPGTPHTIVNQQLKRLLVWDGNDNAFDVGEAFISLGTGQQHPYRDVPNLAEWRRFWGNTEANSIPFKAELAFTGHPHLVDASRANERAWRLAQSVPGDDQMRGAMLNHVGPGQPFDAWRNSSEHNLRSYSTDHNLRSYSTEGSMCQMSIKP